MASHQPELLATIDRLGFVDWSGLTYRHTAPHRDGLSGAGSRAFGGRWNPPDSFPTIYLAQPEEACVGEFRRMAAGQGKGPASFLPRTVHVIEVVGLQVLSLVSPKALQAVGLTPDLLGADDWAPCQLVAQHAYFLGACGIVAPSATGLGLTIAAFEPRVHDQLTVLGTHDLVP